MRIDVYMAKHGLAESRAKAQAMIAEGYVKLNGKTVKKPSAEIGDGEVPEITGELPFVSRGGLKLLRAIEEFSVDPKGLVCADIGASTGGFTDCLLRFGAKRVYAIDSGSDQLHPSLRSDGRVVCMEKTNARALTAETLGERCGLAVMDVSFISQTLLYPAVCTVLEEDGVFISLIKPQFEADASALGKGGILRDPKAHVRVLTRICSEAEKSGLMPISIIPSPIKGGDGNREYLARFAKRGSQAKPLELTRELLCELTGSK